jgi:DNA polymerase-4
MDAFFAAVEQLDHPEWRGRPVIVGGPPTGRGVVSPASYEARRFGVHSAMPSAQAARLCPEAIWVRPRFERYRTVSSELQALFLSVTPHVQPVSIDEAFLDVTPTPHRTTDPVATARLLQQAIDALGLSCSIGVATSKTVAKIASDHDKPHGITVVRPGEEAAFLSPLPVSALPGIGPTTTRTLANLGVRTLGELAGLDERLAAQTLGTIAPSLILRARGIDLSPVRAERDVKSVSHERTFPHDVRERAEVEAEIRHLAAKVGARLRRHHLAGRTVTLKLRYADFTTKTVSRTLSGPTDLDSEVAAAALALLARAWTPGAGLRLLGVGVSGFCAPMRQMGLLDGTDPGALDRERALMHSLDAVRERFGPDSIRFGGDGCDGRLTDDGEPDGS